MEEKLIQEWLKVNNGNGYGSGFGNGYGNGSGNGNGYGSGSGFGYGDGDGDGDGYGSGFGYGYGDGDGDGDGYGSGFGYGSGSGDGNGYGNGYGNGSGNGNGNGSGYGSDVKYYNKNRVFLVDNISTIIKQIKGNIAKGFILNNDLTLESTFVVKGNGYFAHGKTIKEAQDSLQEKMMSDLDVNELLKKFKSEFNNEDKYKGTIFYTWHHYLTGSCTQGRNNFVKNKNIDLEKSYTVKEFLEIVKGSYGWGNLEELEEFYK